MSTEEEDTDFHEGSAAHGLRMWEFNDIDPEKKKKLLRLMARIMEKSYRRGVQQALHLERKGALANLYSEKALSDYRYEKDLDKSIGIDGFNSSSLERLWIENRVLFELGFHE